MNPVYRRADGTIYRPVHGYHPDGNSLCGCGGRTPPPRKEQDRIVKRAVQRESHDLIEEFLKGP